MYSIFSVLITMIALLVANSPLFAATLQSSLGVSASVIAACSLGSIAPVTFGAYDPTAPSPNNAEGSIQTNCTINTPYDIGLDAGNGPEASASNPRFMANLAHLLAYALYQDPSRTQPWGNTIGENTFSSMGTGSLVTQEVYGQVAPGQVVPIGSYTDTVAITVTF